jgi:hypothetical protein
VTSSLADKDAFRRASIMCRATVPLRYIGGGGTRCRFQPSATFSEPIGLKVSSARLTLGVTDRRLCRITAPVCVTPRIRQSRGISRRAATDLRSRYVSVDSPDRTRGTSDSHTVRAGRDVRRLFLGGYDLRTANSRAHSLLHRQRLGQVAPLVAPS